MTRRIRPIAFAATLAALLPGCAVLGRQQKDHRLERASVQKIQKGMTKEQVTQILGAPTEIIFSNKEHDPLREHAYVFEHSTTRYTAISLALINFGNMDEKRDRVVVFFDEGGKVDHVGASLMAENAAHGFPFGR
ncbi:MAG: outer membrane protein assembly factor BamE [Planctomycetes bacterium]|nr:outer membrane protein assembly factor BamE [Planctomycetota bacterium]